MPRRRVALKREILPDPKFGSVLLATFINHLMLSGKKAVAEKIVYGALDDLSERAKGQFEPLDSAEGDAEEGGSEGAGHVGLQA